MKYSKRYMREMHWESSPEARKRDLQLARDLAIFSAGLLLMWFAWAVWP